MSESLVWFFYLLGGAAACATVARLQWRIVPATLAGALLATLLWIVSLLLVSAEDRPYWFRLHLAMNLSLAIIFAAGGAALGFWLASRRRSD